MEKNLISMHKLTSDYSTRGKLKGIISGWVIFLLLFGITRIPAVQHAITQFSGSMAVTWLTDMVNFIINGLWIIAIPLLVGTVLTITKKQVFDTLFIHDTGIGFFNSKSGIEHCAAYSDIKLSYGNMQKSFLLESKAASIKSTEYSWSEFTQPDILRNNLERYGKWN
ncbi:MAG: hypothetical protein LBL49_10470 [Clostridiales Family XIII bacterium]|jgi:hypothetical protein|nr:hypothetical protein [Clostridiales Family XIII bacterium]